MGTREQRRGAGTRAVVRLPERKRERAPAPEGYILHGLPRGPIRPKSARQPKTSFVSPVRLTSLNSSTPCSEPSPPSFQGSDQNLGPPCHLFLSPCSPSISTSYRLYLPEVSRSNRSHPHTPSAGPSHCPPSPGGRSRPRSSLPPWFPLRPLSPQPLPAGDGHSLHTVPLR